MRVRVATLNVWALPGMLAEDVPQRMEAIGDRLQTLPVDVVALQEVWTAEAREALRSAGARAGFEHAAHETDSIGGSGLMTLSRLPIEAVRFERFQVRGHPEHLNGEYLSGKGFAVLELATPEGPLTIINTHLHARYAKARDHCYSPHRTAQLIQLAMGCAELHGPLVVLGDFNFSEGQPEYQVLTGLTGMRDVAVELDRRTPTVDSQIFYRRDSTRPARRVDMIFVRDGGRRGIGAHSVERSFDELLDFDGRPGGYSNHAALLAEVELRPSRGVGPAAVPRRAVEVAAQLLAEGRVNAERRQSEGRVFSVAGLACALFSTAGLRRRSVTRRRLLRGSLRAGLLVGLTPGLGLPVFSELFVPDEIQAFDEAAARLAWLEARQLQQSELAAGFSAGDTASAVPSPRS